MKKLDVIANEAFITALKRSKKVCVMVRYSTAHCSLFVKENIDSPMVFAVKRTKSTSW